MTTLLSKRDVFRGVRGVLALSATLFVFTWPSHAAIDVTTGDGANIERQLLDDAADGRLDQHSLIEAALIAGGTTNRAKLRELETRFESLADEISWSVSSQQTAGDRALAIRSALHQRLLAEYGVNASDVGKTLENGAFNCVSASVLFVVLAERCGLNAHAVQLPEHVRCEVIADGLAMPIETTSATITAQRVSARGSSRKLNDVKIIATIYYNRGVTAFDKGDLDLAIELNTIATRLDPGCQPARDNLLAAINNRVVELVKGHKSAQALELLDQGLRIDPAYRPFLANRAYLQRQSP